LERKRMKSVAIVFFVAFVALSLAETTTTSFTLKNGLSLVADQNGFTLSGTVSRSTFSVWIGAVVEKSASYSILRNTTYGTASIGDFSFYNNYWTTSLTVPMSIMDSAGNQNSGQIVFTINTYTADSFFQWGTENISCPSGSVKLIPAITWPTAVNLNGDYLSLSGSASWQVSALDLAEAITDGVIYSPVYDSNEDQTGATIGIKGGIGLYFTFPGKVRYGAFPYTWGSMTFKMTTFKPSLTGSQNWEVDFDSISTFVTFDPVIKLEGGSGAGSLGYSISLIFLVLIALINFL